MSFTISAEVWAHSQAKGSSKYVLLALADYADDDDRICWPSIASIGAKTGLGKNTVRRALRDIEKLGEIEVVSPGGGTTSTRYVITRYRFGPGPKSHPVPNLTPSQNGTGPKTSEEGVQNGYGGGPKWTPNLSLTSQEPLGALDETGTAEVRSCKAIARDLTQLAFRQPIKPSLKSRGEPFCAAQRIIEAQIKAGTDPRLIEAAVRRGVDVWTKAGLQVAITRAKQSGAVALGEPKVVQV